MDIEPTTMGGRKTLDLIQKNDLENRNYSQANELLNRSTIFDFVYFWSIFLLSTSFFLDLILYFCYYQEKNNEGNYQASTFFIRLITDSLFISPLLIYIRFALNRSSKIYILGIIIFLPQLILNIISLAKINNQEFITIESLNNTSFLNITNEKIINSTKLTDNRVKILKISPLINVIIYIITIILTYLKIFKNF